MALWDTADPAPTGREELHHLPAHDAVDLRACGSGPEHSDRRQRAVFAGQSAFYAVGAYTSAILMEHVGMNYALTLPIAGIICFALDSCSACRRCV